MYFGCDYYPEHWPKERWEEDARLMKEARFNVVRLGEFAWVKMEPEEGSFSFNWLDEAIEILGRHEIKTVLGTPTATPPAWLVKKHLEVLRVDENGIRSSFGGRRAYCPNNDIYHQFSKKIVQEMVEHFKNNKNVIGWQIDNEFGGDSSEGLCYCDVCASKFRKWLKKKYRSLDNLNKEWGTIFWSQTYGDWEEIPVPRKLETAHNPSLILDYRRFISDSYISYQELQRKILKDFAPHQFVTHNFMAHFNGIDYYNLAKPLDFVAWDNYPKLHFVEEGKEYYDVSFGHDLIRGLKRKSFWVMEEQSGPSGWQCVDPTPEPGEIRLWTYQAIAHGAEGVLYFRWRTCRYGTEQFWHGILDAWGKVNRRYEEVKQIGKELKKIEETLAEMEFSAEVAILNSYDIQWAFAIQPNNEQFNYRKHFLSYYQIFNRWGINVDAISWQDDFSKYKIIVAPSLFLLQDDFAIKLRDFVKNGGLLVVTFRSGIKNWNNVTFEDPFPAPLRDFLGIEVEEYDSLLPEHEQGREIEIIHPDFKRTTGEGKIWCDIVKCDGAEVVACYSDGYYQGRPSITINKFERGKAIYIGTDPSEEIKENILFWAMREAGVNRPFLNIISNVEVVQQSKGERELIFLLNHSSKEQYIELNKEYVSILEDKEYSQGETIILEPKGVGIILRKL